MSEAWDDDLPPVAPVAPLDPHALAHARMAADLPGPLAPPAELPTLPTATDARRHWLVVCRDGEPPVVVPCASAEAQLQQLHRLRAQGDVYAVAFDGAVLQYTRPPVHLYLADGETVLRLDAAGRVERLAAATVDAPPPADDYFAGEELPLSPFAYRDPETAAPDSTPPAPPKRKRKRD